MSEEMRPQDIPTIPSIPCVNTTSFSEAGTGHAGSWQMQEHAANTSSRLYDGYGKYSYENSMELFMTAASMQASADQPLDGTKLPVAEQFSYMHPSSFNL